MWQGQEDGCVYRRDYITMERSKLDIKDYQQENLDTREQEEAIINYHFDFNFGDRETEESSI